MFKSISFVTGCCYTNHKKLGVYMILHKQYITHQIRVRPRPKKHRQRFTLGTYLLEEDDGPLSRFNSKTGDELKLAISSKHNIEIFVKIMTEREDSCTLVQTKLLMNLRHGLLKVNSISVIYIVYKRWYVDIKQLKLT